MLKRLLHIAMALLLMISITGLTIHKHYCHGELTGLSVFVDANHCCEASCTHCKDVTVSNHLDVDLFSANVQAVPENIQLSISSFEMLPAVLPEILPCIQHLTRSTKTCCHVDLHGIPMLQSFRC